MAKRNNYELIIVVDANMTDEESQAVFDKHKQNIVSAGGEIKFGSAWGRRRLAYEIEKKKYGIYHILFLEGSGDVIEEVERQFGYDEKVVKYFVTAVEDLEDAYNKFEALKANPSKNAKLVSEVIGA